MFFFQLSMDSIYKQFETALKRYQDDTQERRQDFEMLKEKDDTSSKIIDTQMKKIQRIQQSISDLKDKMHNNAKDADFQNKTLKQEYEMMQTQYRLIKKSMNNQRERWRDRLTQVTLLSNGAIKKLTSVKEKAERIMRNAEMCRSLMTEEEKVLPFYSTSLSNEELGEVQVDSIEIFLKFIFFDIFIKTLSFKNFHGRKIKFSFSGCGLRTYGKFLETL